MSLQLPENIDEEEFSINPENLLKDGIDIIYKLYNSNLENYTEQIEELKKIINDLNKKLELMKEEIEMYQRENEYYKSQNKKLKNEVDNMNKVVNNIKGKLINFDVNINSKQIVEDINQEYLTNNTYHKYNTKGNIKNEDSIFNSIRNKFEINNHTINNKNYNNNIFDKNQEFSRNSHTIRNDINRLNIKDIIYDNEINGMNNDDIISGINSGKNDKNFYEERKMNTLYNDSCLRNRNKLNKKNFNEENSKNNYYSNNNEFIEHSYLNKRNINFNSYKNINTYRRKNKIKNNSVNYLISKGKIKDDIKYLIKNNNGKITSKNKGYIKSKEEFLKEYSYNFNYNNQTCKTFTNNKDRNSIIKELKKKEISFFIEKCGNYLEKKDFEIIFQIYQKYKEEIIKDENIIKQIKSHLKQNEELINLFNNIIS